MSAATAREVVVTPRAYPFEFRHEGLCAQHYAIIGTACVADGYPLYYDAVNEKGLGMAGLNFVGNAAYAAPCAGKRNVAQFEFIPWLLGRCAGLAEARAALAELNLVGTPFSAPLPCRAAPLARGGPDGRARGRVHGGRLHVYDCPEGVLTNNPPFPIQHFGLNRYLGLSPRQRKIAFLTNWSFRRSAAAWARWVCRATSVRLALRARGVRRANSRSGESEAARVGQFFHILGAVEQQKGCCELRPGEFEYDLHLPAGTRSAGVLLLTTYGCRQIHAVDLPARRSRQRGPRALSHANRRTDQFPN